MRLGTRTATRVFCCSGGHHSHAGHSRYSFPVNPVWSRSCSDCQLAGKIRPRSFSSEHDNDLNFLFERVGGFGLQLLASCGIKAPGGKTAITLKVLHRKYFARCLWSAGKTFLIADHI